MMHKCFVRYHAIIEGFHSTETEEVGGEEKQDNLMRVK